MDVGFKILVNTNDAYLQLGPFVIDGPVCNDDIRAIIAIALEGKNWDYTINDVEDIVLVCMDMETLDTRIFDVEISDVWPDDSDRKIVNHYCVPKGGE